MTDNIDRIEITKFEALAHRWWDKNGEYKPLHDINPLRANYIDCHSPVAECRLLDVGCGGGILCEAMAYRGAMVTGIDKGEMTLEVARLHLLESGLTVDYRNSTAEALVQQEPESYDIVTCLEVLEHVPDPASVIKACADLTKPGGHIYFSTINRHPTAYLFAIIGAEYVLQLLPKGTHDYQNFIKPSEMASGIREAGLQLQDITGMTYNPLTKRYRLDSYKVHVNYLVRAKKFQSDFVHAPGR